MTNKTEDDQHILSARPWNKGLNSKQHDFIVNKISKELIKTQPQAKVFRERAWRLGTELLRPDISLMQDNQYKIIQVTIPYVISNSYLYDF